MGQNLTQPEEIDLALSAMAGREVQPGVPIMDGAQPVARGAGLEGRAGKAGSPCSAAHDKLARGRTGDERKPGHAVNAR